MNQYNLLYRYMMVGGYLRLYMLIPLSLFRWSPTCERWKCRSTLGGHSRLSHGRLWGKHSRSRREHSRSLPFPGAYMPYHTALKGPWMTDLNMDWCIRSSGNNISVCRYWLIGKPQERINKAFLVQSLHICPSTCSLTLVLEFDCLSVISK